MWFQCAWLDRGAIRCWGSDYDGVLGYGTNYDGAAVTPSQAGDVDVGGFVTDVAAGQGHTCVALDSGSLRCWGWPAFGKLGLGYEPGYPECYASCHDGPECCFGDDEAPATMDPVPVGAPVVRVAAGEHNTCAIVLGGGLRCWGHGFLGGLGYGNTATIGDDETPQSVGDIPMGGPVVQVSAGGDHSCAVLLDGTIRCWGMNNEGQLGYGKSGNVGDDETPAEAGPVPVWE